MTRDHRAPALALILAFAVAACGGGATATKAGPTAAGGGTEPTQGVEPTIDGGGGGGLLTGNGKVTFEVKVEGQSKASGELPFIPVTSLFDPNATSLTFGLSGTDEALIITLSGTGLGLASYGNSTIAVSGTDCKMSGLTLTTTEAKGSFECTTGLVTTATGLVTAGISFTGTFEAHK